MHTLAPDHEKLLSIPVESSVLSLEQGLDMVYAGMRNGKVITLDLRQTSTRKMRPQV